MHLSPGSGSPYSSRYGGVTVHPFTLARSVVSKSTTCASSIQSAIPIPTPQLCVRVCGDNNQLLCQSFPPSLFVVGGRGGGGEKEGGKEGGEKEGGKRGGKGEGRKGGGRRRGGG